MPNLIVVDDPARWPLHIPGVEVVPARRYLTDAYFTRLRRTRVFNLCRSYRYQRLGYYVSLLAAARGHKPLPSVSALLDLRSQAIVRVASEELEALIQKSLAPIQSREFVLSVYFGRNLARRYDRLSQHLFKLFQAPLLRATFAVQGKSGKWQLQGVGPIAGSDIPENHRDFVVEVAQDYFEGRRQRSVRRNAARYDMAILVDPGEAEPPSDARALRRVVKAAEATGFAVELIGREDIGRLAEFDALFIRETTRVNHHTYRLARRAAAEGLVVMDDPESILKCTNKVFLAELLERNGIVAPRTVIVHRDTLRQADSQVGLPCVLKEPDSAFSRGVLKVETPEAFDQTVTQMLEKSELVIAQEFLPTEFDWRIGILDRRALYACRYYMARQHWQILRRDSQGEKQAEGGFDTIAIEKAPKAVVRTALKAANLIGDGLYGVDLKQVGNRVYVIEINDNPSLDAGVEDKVLGSELYLELMRSFLRRVEMRKSGGRG